MRGLGATPVIPTWEDRLDENAFTPADVAAIIRKHAPAGSDLKTVSEYGDEYHSDHFACHDAVASLFAGGWTDPLITATAGVVLLTLAYAVVDTGPIAPSATGWPIRSGPGAATACWSTSACTWR